MSAVAKKLAAAPPAPAPPKRHGPANLCGSIYEPDIEDAKAIEEFRKRANESWKTAQRMWDTLVGVEASQRIPNDKFRYHWNLGCGCWPDDLRQR
jgi:hypothetical protein